LKFPQVNLGACDPPAKSPVMTKETHKIELGEVSKRGTSPRAGIGVYDESAKRPIHVKTDPKKENLVNSQKIHCNSRRS